MGNLPLLKIGLYYYYYHMNCRVIIITGDRARSGEWRLGMFGGATEPGFGYNLQQMNLALGAHFFHVCRLIKDHQVFGWWPSFECTKHMLASYMGGAKA